MKNLLLSVCIFILCGSLISSYASQKAVSSTTIDTNSVHIYGMAQPKYVTQYFNGYENSRFPRRSYYIPSYCQPGAAMNNGMNNPFCNQYLPYGSGIYTNF